jgi:hypothetical protein
MMEDFKQVMGGWFCRQDEGYVTKEQVKAEFEATRTTYVTTDKFQGVVQDHINAIIGGEVFESNMEEKVAAAVEGFMGDDAVRADVQAARHEAANMHQMARTELKRIKYSMAVAGDKPQRDKNFGNLKLIVSKGEEAWSKLSSSPGGKTQAVLAALGVSATESYYVESITCTGEHPGTGVRYIEVEIKGKNGKAKITNRQELEWKLRKMQVLQLPTLPPVWRGTWCASLMWSLRGCKRPPSTPPHQMIATTLTTSSPTTGTLIGSRASATWSRTGASSSGTTSWRPLRSTLLTYSQTSTTSTTLSTPLSSPPVRAIGSI